MFAPHLLGHSIPRSMLNTLSCLVIAPLLNTCHKCREELTVIARRQVVVYDNRSGPTPGDLLTSQCVRCRDRFEGCWRVPFRQAQPGNVKATTNALRGQRSCIGIPTSYFSIRQGMVFFSCRFLDNVLHAILYSHSTFPGLAKTSKHDVVGAQLQSDHLFEAWLIFSLMKFFDADSFAIHWHFTVTKKAHDMAVFFHSIMSSIQHRCRVRWFLNHVCDVCANKALGIDGNAKHITRLCAHTDDGWMKSKRLNASCAVGCTSRPTAGRLRYCPSLINEHWPIS